MIPEPVQIQLPGYGKSGELMLRHLLFPLQKAYPMPYGKQTRFFSIITIIFYDFL